MSQKTNLGKVCVTPKGAHDSTLEYAILDIVTDNGSSYIAIQDVPANTDISDTDYWQLIASKGGTGEITEVTASISGGYGTPGVTVTEGGTTTEKTLAFAFTNLVGSGISSITGEKTGTSGAVDTYTLTITYENGNTDTVTYTVTNGSVTSVAGKTGAVTLDASDIGYDGTASGLSADDVQEAIDEVVEGLEDGTIVPNKSLSTDSINPVSEESGTTQDAPFISQGTGTANNTASVDVSPVAKQLEKQGNTVVENQKLSHGDFDSTTGWQATADGVISVSDNVISAVSSNGSQFFGFISQDSQVIMTVGHKYLLMIEGKASVSNLLVYAPYWNDSRTSENNTRQEIGTSWTPMYKVVTCTTAGAVNIGVRKYTGDYGSEVTIYGRNAHVHDLTQWFNGNDNIPQDLLDHPENFGRYYAGSLANNTGSLVNSSGRYLVCTQGKDGGHSNLWDEQTEIVDSLIASKNIIRVVPNKKIYFWIKNAEFIPSYGVYIQTYDGQGNVISSYTRTFLSDSGQEGHIFEVPASVYAIKFGVSTSYYGGTTYNHDITVSLYYAPEEGGEGYNQYYPFVAPKVYDTGTEELLAAGSVMDTKLPDGTVTKVVGSIDLGSLTWTYENSTFVSNEVSGIKSWTGADDVLVTNIVCAKYITMPRDTLDNGGVASKVQKILIKDSAYSDAATFTTAMSGVYLQYELATPTTTQGTSFPENIEVDDYGMMYWLDTDNNLVSTPQGCKIFYPADYVLYTDTLFTYTEGDPENLALKGNLGVGDADTLQGVNDRISASYDIAQASAGNTLRWVLANANSLSYSATDYKDIGKLTWTRYLFGSYYVWFADLSNIGNTNKILLNLDYPLDTNHDVVNMSNKTYTTATTYIYVRDDDITTADDWNAVVNGVLIAYEKAST